MLNYQTAYTDETKAAYRDITEREKEIFPTGATCQVSFEEYTRRNGTKGMHAIRPETDVDPYRPTDLNNDQWRHIMHAFFRYCLWYDCTEEQAEEATSIAILYMFERIPKNFKVRRGEHWFAFFIARKMLRRSYFKGYKQTQERGNVATEQTPEEWLHNQTSRFANPRPDSLATRRERLNDMHKAAAVAMQPAGTRGRPSLEQAATAREAYNAGQRGTKPATEGRSWGALCKEYAAQSTAIVEHWREFHGLNLPPQTGLVVDTFNQPEPPAKPEEPIQENRLHRPAKPSARLPMFGKYWEPERKAEHYTGKKLHDGESLPQKIKKRGEEQTAKLDALCEAHGVTVTEEELPPTWQPVKQQRQQMSWLTYPHPNEGQYPVAYVNRWAERWEDGYYVDR